MGLLISNAEKEFLAWAVPQIASVAPNAAEAQSIARYLFGFSNDLMPNSQQQYLTEGVAKILQHQPVQYVAGKAWFYDRVFTVNPAVLIPRQETEEIVHAVVRYVKGNNPKAVVADLCTGSGCIGISVGLESPKTTVYGADISDTALVVANQNAENLGASNVKFYHADVLRGWPKDFPNVIDVLVSNPPYVTEAEKSLMAKNVLDHEPALALFVPDEDAMHFYKPLAAFARQHLAASGVCYFEINEAKGEEVAQLCRDNNLVNVSVMQDLHGRDRWVFAQQHNISI